jgi:hypothetical protein
MPAFPSLSPLTKRLLILASSALLAACSPPHDWREIRADEDRFRAMMPARPDRMTLPIDLDGLAVQMTMQGARVEEVAYTVATAALPDATVATRERALAAMRTGMVRNIGGRELSAEALPVPVIDASGAIVGSAPGWRVEAEGQAGGQKVSLQAIFAAREGRAWQAVVIGPAPDPEHTRTFLDGLRLVD